MLLESASDTSSCLNCGSHVTSDFRRVYGDSEDRVHRCRECDTLVRLHRGSGAGLEVKIPDPQHSLGRHGGQPERWSK
ncbi:DUF7563 family protein [Haloferax larsenii]|uniref:DUF7563 family protein n=1 Tax=Haloferax larsenii TaxID=302484 RepID=UPI00215A4422|nr:hypothetical protein [Haloferax larsenii]